MNSKIEKILERELGKVEQRIQEEDSTSKIGYVTSSLGMWDIHLESLLKNTSTKILVHLRLFMMHSWPYRKATCRESYLTGPKTEDSEK